MSRDVVLYLNDIVEAIAFIRSFTKGMSQEDFAGDEKTQHACIRDLVVIGEAVKSLPESQSQTARRAVEEDSRTPRCPHPRVFRHRCRDTRGIFRADLRDRRREASLKEGR